MASMTNDHTEATHLLGAWSPMLSSSLERLRLLAGSTESEVLEIGSEIQEIYHASSTLAHTAKHLVEVTSRERIQTLLAQLLQILREIETFLERTQSQSSNSLHALHSVDSLLAEITKPLEGFKKMSKNLYILEVLIKIESAHIGEGGSEFNTLAQEIRKLSGQIKDKATTINDHRLLLGSMVARHVAGLSTAKTTQEHRVKLTLNNTATSISELESVNERFAWLGEFISRVSVENSDAISDVVQSMQFHDMFRQQLEHIVDALDGLTPLFASPRSTDSEKEKSILEAIATIGDVCELQEAQLHFASAELQNAVALIISNLQEIGTKQKGLSNEMQSQSQVIDGSGSSFIDNVKRHMMAVAAQLNESATTNNALASVMDEIRSTVGMITRFVSDIEDIGQDVILIALNARIKASDTGSGGASLCALAEEIGQISKEDIHRTDTITSTLKEIHSVTGQLAAEAQESVEVLSKTLEETDANLRAILGTLEHMGSDLFSLLAKIQLQTDGLTGDIDRITSGIDIHNRTKALADEVLEVLRQIIEQSRSMCPASDAFKQDLRRLADEYTMESERRIHEIIARKHGVGVASPAELPVGAITTNDSEFGDNVDLF